jgi:hypothetical protein
MVTEELTAERIAKQFDERAKVQLGCLEDQTVFQVDVYGGTVGYIVPGCGGVWGVNLSQGAHDLRGYFKLENIPFQTGDGDWGEKSELVLFASL